MIKFSKSALAGALLAALAHLPAAHAGILEDDEARKAILDLRAKVDALSRDLAARIDNKADKSAALELANQIQALRQDIARLQGEVEVLTNELSNAQKRQKDLYADLDARLRKLEPQQVTVDGIEATVDQAEQRAYEAGLASFKNNDYKTAARQMGEFVRRYPSSAYAATMQYMLGNAHYLLQDCKSAIPAYQAMVRNHADNPKAADAQLGIASCHVELKEKAAARKAFDAVVKNYPNSEAAKSAKASLAALK